MAINSEKLFLNRAKFVMKMMGVWLPPKNESAVRKIFRIFMMFLQYLLLLFQTIYIFQVWGDLGAVSQASYLLFTQASLCFKVTVFQVNSGILRQMLNQMKTEIFKPQSVEHEQILISHAKRIKKLLLVFMISSQVTCGLWALKSLLDDVESRDFPLDMWMPVPPNKSPHYELGFAFQFITISMSAYMYFGVDSVAFSMIIYGCAQIDIVKKKIMSIISPQDATGSERSKLLSANYKILIESVIQHQAVVTLTQHLENAFHIYLLFQLMGSVGIFCMSALLILVIDWQSMQFFSIISYIFVMLSQLFICCWCGHELTSTSDDLHTVMYKCLWYEQDLKFKRDLCFAMMRMNRPIVLRAGHYITLSRQIFVAILRMSYSYFAVLNQAK